MNNNKLFKTVTNIYTGEETDSNIVNAKEIEIIKRLVTKDDIVLDIGANIGFMTIQLAQQAKHVYAFEPAPDNYKQLQKNTKHLDNVTRHRMAITDTIGDKVLSLCPLDPGMNRLYNSKWCEGGKRILVPATTIDILLLEDNSRLTHKINFIKVDVEGYEYHVIMGMMNVLKRDHPTILMEFHPPSIEESGANPEDIYNLLKHELGYNDPINVCTGDTITPSSYNELDKQTRDIPATNILWQYN